MASKEATVYIVDCGLTMGEKSGGRQKSNLDFALQYVWDRVTSTVATGRKTALIGVVGLRTDGTENDLSSEEEYHHINVFQPISQLLMPQVHRLRTQLQVSKTSIGDATSALVVAIQMISETCKKLQYIRRIVLVTDARAPMHTDDLSQITSKIKDDHIEVTILGVDFDDAEYGFKEEDKDAIKAENEVLLKTFCEDCDGNYGTLAQAVDELEIPRIKVTKSVNSFRGILTLGNPEEYTTALSIDVERYPKVMVARAPTSSQFVVKNGSAPANPTQSSATLSTGDEVATGAGDALAAVRSTRTYQIVDEEAPGGKRDIGRDDLSRGYEYGRTAVHISESDQNVTTYETTQGLDIIGFVDKHQYERYFDMSRTSMMISQKNNDKASMALSSLIHALYELDTFAVARLVVKENKEPKILLLAPNIEPDFECLYDVELPFAEDARSYKFPPLDRVVTVSGKTLSVHRNLPDDDLVEAMGRYVDSMDLSTFDKDETGEPTEYLPIDDTYSPAIHRINQVIKHRAVYPDAELPPPFGFVTKYSQPPGELVAKSKPALEAIIKAADLKKIPPKARGKRYRKEVPKPLSDLDVGALLAQDPKRKSKRISSDNAVPEFKQILTTADNVDELHDACRQLKAIIFNWIQHSVGGSNYGQAVEGIRVMREEMIELEEPKPFNDFLIELKAKLLGGDLGGDRNEMWYRIRVSKLGLVLRNESEGSDVTEEAARQFMLVK